MDGKMSDDNKMEEFPSSKLTKEESKCHDITKLIDLYNLIEQYSEDKLNLQETLEKIGDIAGGNKRILFNYSDEECYYIRNKYGYIRRKKGNKTKPNEDGIYFEKLYYLKIILEENEEFEFVDDEAKRLKEDLTALKEKIKYILHREEEFIRSKDELVSLVEPLNLTINSNNPKISDIIRISKKYYDQHILRKIKYELDNFDLNFNFEIREDRYYFARKLVIIGEVLKHFMEDEAKVEDKKNTLNAFKQFMKMRDSLIHCHKIISTGVNEKEHVEYLNKNIKEIVKSMSDIIKAEDGNNLVVNYADKETASTLTEIFQKLIQCFGGKRKKADKNSPKSIIVSFYTKLKLAENIKPLTKDTKIVTDLNAKYQKSFENLSDSEKNYYVDYPKCLSLDNKEKIAEIAEKELSLKMVETLKKIGAELNYLTRVEKRKDIPTQIGYVIEHSCSIIGQYQRDLGEILNRSPNVAKSYSEISSVVSEEASTSAKSARNQLAHNIFALDPEYLEEVIKRDIIPAREHFKAMLTIYDQQHRNIPVSIRKLIELADSFFTLGLYNDAIDCNKQIIKRAEEHPQEINEEKIEEALTLFELCPVDGILDIYQWLFGMEFYSFRAYKTLSHIYLLFGNHESASEVLRPLTDKMTMIKHLRPCSRNRIFIEEIADISHHIGVCSLYQGLWKEAKIHLENAINLFENAESSSPRLCQSKLHLALCYSEPNRLPEAKNLLEAILEQSELNSYLEVSSLQFYTALLLEIDDQKLISMKSKFVDKTKSFSKNIINEKGIVGNNYLGLQLEAILIELRIIDRNIVYEGQANHSLSDLQEQLESLEEQCNQIISKIKGDSKRIAPILNVYAYIGTCYASLIPVRNSEHFDEENTFGKGNSFFEKTKYYFDKVKKLYKEQEPASQTHEYAFIQALHSLGRAYNNYALLIDDFGASIGYLEKALHWRSFILSSNFNLSKKLQNGLTNEKCSTLGNLGYEYHYLGMHYFLGIGKYEKSFDDALKYFEIALSHFEQMLELNENKIYINGEREIEIFESFARSYEFAGLLKCDITFMIKAMKLFNEAMESWENKEEILKLQQKCRENIDYIRSRFKGIQKGLNQEHMCPVNSDYRLNISFRDPYYCFPRYIKTKELPIKVAKLKDDFFKLQITKRNIMRLKSHFEQELQSIRNIDEQVRKLPNTFIFTFKNNQIENNNESLSQIELNKNLKSKFLEANQKGVEYYKARNFLKSIEKYNEAHQLLSKLPESASIQSNKTILLFNRARAFHENGNLLSAISDYTATLELNNTHENALKYLEKCSETDSDQITTEQKNNIKLFIMGINIKNTILTK